jgi:hypothetical protein
MAVKAKKPILREVQAVYCPTCDTGRQRNANSAKDTPGHSRIVTEA